MRKVSIKNLKSVLAILGLLIGLSISAYAQSEVNEKGFEKTTVDHEVKYLKGQMKQKTSLVIETEPGLSFVVKVKADSVKLIFPFRDAMDNHRKDIWVVDYKLKNASKSAINWGYIVYSGGESSLHHGIAWRGSMVKEAYPASEELKGEVSDFKLESKFTNQTRDVTVYLPPGHDQQKQYPVLYVADGWWTNELAKRVDPLILSGTLRSMVIVGMHSSGYEGKRNADFSDHDPFRDIRAREYIKDYLVSYDLMEGEDSVFVNHMKFFTEEVPEWAEKKFGASSKRRDKLVAGYSNGAAFVASLLAAYPDEVGAATMLSLAGWSTVVDSLDRAPEDYPRMYMAAGYYEPGFLRNAEKVFHKLKDYGCDVQMNKAFTGHDMFMWNQELISSVLDYFNNEATRERSYPREVTRKLEGLEEKDQELRLKMDEVREKHGLKSQVYGDLVDRIHSQDGENMKVLESIINEYGWPDLNSTSKKANRAAFLIVQHSSLGYQQKYLPMILASAREGETPARMVALLQDRVLMREGRKQMYGSQLVDIDGRLRVWTIEAPEQVDERRASVGLKPLSEYLKYFDVEYEHLPLKKMPEMY